MSANIHILKASGRLEPYEDLILDTAENALQDIKSRIHIPEVDIVVEDNPDYAIPDQATGGVCPAAHLVRISVNPEFDDIENVLADEIRSGFAHELHHAARKATVGYGDTLREVLISEGLAGHFDIAVNDGEPKPWDVAIQGGKLEAMKEFAKEELDNENYNHYRWFFGTGDENIPHWTGYSLAFELVGDYLEETGETAGELVDVPAEDISII